MDTDEEGWEEDGFVEIRGGEGGHIIYKLMCGYHYDKQFTITKPVGPLIMNMFSGRSRRNFNKFDIRFKAFGEYAKELLLIRATLVFLTVDDFSRFSRPDI